MRNKKIITLLLAATVALTSVAPSIQVKAEEVPGLPGVNYEDEVPGLPGVTYEDLEKQVEEAQKAAERDMAEDVKNSSASTNYGSIKDYFSEYFGKDVIQVDGRMTITYNGEKNTGEKGFIATWNCDGMLLEKVPCKNGTKVTVTLSDSKNKKKFVGKVKKSVVDISWTPRVVARNIWYKTNNRGLGGKHIKKKNFKNQKAFDKWGKKNELACSSVGYIGFKEITINIHGYGIYKVYGTAAHERQLKNPKEVKDYSNIYEWGYETTEYTLRYK